MNTTTGQTGESRKGASRWRRGLVLAFLAALTGLLNVLPWFEGRVFVTAWAGMAILVGICHGQPAYRVFRWCFLSGLVFEAIGFRWYPSIAADVLNVSWFSGAMVVLMIFTWDAFRIALAGWAVAWLKPRADWACLLWPVAYVAFEWGWPHIFPWRMGHSQWGWLPVLQIAEFTGVYGVSFLVVWGAACCAMLVRTWRNRSENSAVQRGLRVQISVCVVTLLAAVGWGHWRIADIERQASGQPQLTVALIQPGGRGNQKVFLNKESQRVGDDVDLIVWPETTAKRYSLDLTSFRDPDEVRAHSDSKSRRQRPAPEVGCYVLLNGGSFPHGLPKEGPFYNTSFLVDNQQQIIGRYHKRVLMPWGEYVVGQQKIPGLRELLGGYAEYIPGTDPSPLSLPGEARLGLLTCYEDLIEKPARESCRAGANVLINQSNLLAFGHSGALWGHQRIAFIRTVENRRSLLRCGITGSTAIFTATGRLEQQAPTHVPATLIATIPLFDTPTAYALWGDVFAGTCVVIVCLLFGWHLFFRPTPRRATKQAAEDCQHQ